MDNSTTDKKSIKEVTPPHPLRGEIYWTNLEPAKGSEQRGSRPVLIISNNLMNQYAKVVIVIPMTRSGDKTRRAPFNVPYNLSDVTLDSPGIRRLDKIGYHFALQNGFLLCNQARAISTTRIIGRVGVFNNKTIIKKVELAITDSFGLSSCEDCGIPLRPNGLLCLKCGRVYRIKCIKCSYIFSNTYKYCPQCGRRV